MMDSFFDKYSDTFEKEGIAFKELLVIVCDSPPLLQRFVEWVKNINCAGCHSELFVYNPPIAVRKTGCCQRLTHDGCQDNCQDCGMDEVGDQLNDLRIQKESPSNNPAEAPPEDPVEAAPETPTRPKEKKSSTPTSAQKNDFAMEVVQQAWNYFELLGKPSVKKLQRDAKLTVTVLDKAPSDGDIKEKVSVYSNVHTFNTQAQSLVSAYNLGLIAHHLTTRVNNLSITAVSNLMKVNDKTLSKYIKFYQIVKGNTFGIPFLFTCSVSFHKLTQTLNFSIKNKDTTYLELAMNHLNK